MPPIPEMVELDDRDRVSLRKIANPKHRRYLVQVHDDGTIVLQPAHLVSEAQLRYWANPDVMAQVEASLAAHEADPSTTLYGLGIPAKRGTA